MLALLLSILLQTIEVQVGTEPLVVELADTPSARAKGLAGREALLEGSGMLFVFEKPQSVSFWMKDTKIPLSIAFFNEEKVLLNIEEMNPPTEPLLPLFESNAPAKYALEVPQGWFQKHNISPGMRLKIKN